MHAKKNASEHGPRGRGRRVEPRQAARQATIEAVLAELERTQHTKVVLEHLAALLLSEFTGSGDEPPKIKVGVDAVGAVPVRDEVIEAVHDLLFSAVRDAERRQQALLASEVNASVLLPATETSSSLALLSTREQEKPRGIEPAGRRRDRFIGTGRS